MKPITAESRVGWITHTYGPISPKVYFNHIGCMLRWSRKFNIVFAGIDKHRTADARNLLIDDALAMNCTHILIIDADHKLPPHMLECLSKNEDAAVVSGLITKRKPPYHQVGFVKDGEGYAPIDLPIDGRSYLVDIPAMGCTLIDAEVFQTIEKPYFMDSIGTKSDGSLYNKRSDTNFFEKLQRANYKMIVDTRVLVGHTRDEEFVYPNDVPDVKELNRMNKVWNDFDAVKYQLRVYQIAQELSVKYDVDSVLDLGCGNPTKLLNEFDECVGRITGVDFHSKMLDIAAVGAKAKAGTKCKWIGQDLDEEFDLREKFDLVITADVIEHVNRPDMLLSNIKRHMSEESILVLSSPEKATVQELNSLHVREFSKEELSTLLTAHGLEIIECEVYKEENLAPYDNNVFVCKLKEGVKNGNSDKTKKSKKDLA
jgi:2-polyprenyl-3-methyl-5-hydroxy-6-metoxy-1,4-benzoquinol methylase